MLAREKKIACNDLQTGGPYERLTWILQPSADVATGVAIGFQEPHPSVLELAVFVTVLETMTVFESVGVAVAGALQSCQVDVEPSSLLYRVTVIHCVLVFVTVLVASSEPDHPVMVVV